MNFGEVIKNEILSKEIKDSRDKLAFLAGFFRGAGEIFEKENGEIGIQLTAQNDIVLMEIGKLLRTLFDYELREVSVLEDRLNQKDRFLMVVDGEKVLDILESLEIIVEDKGDLIVNTKFFGEIVKTDSSLRAFIRGYFLASGSCTLPSGDTDSKTGYHLELVFSHYDPALETSEKLAEFGVLTKITRRKDSFIVYIKSSEEIKDFIAFLPAPISVLKITDLIINRNLSNNSNRQKNCDLGNVGKQVEASGKQIEAIEKIIATIGLDSLKRDIIETAKARQDNPDDTLSELAEKLNISKSCLNHRLRKIVSIADNL